MIKAMVGPKVALVLDSPSDSRWTAGVELLEGSQAAVALAGLTLATDPATDNTGRRLRIEIACPFEPLMVMDQARARLHATADKDLHEARRVIENASKVDPRFAQLFAESGVVYEYVYDYGMGCVLIATARREGPWVWKWHAGTATKATSGFCRSARERPTCSESRASDLRLSAYRPPSRRRSGRSVQFVLNGAPNPCGDRSVVGVRAALDLGEQLGREPDRDRRGESLGAPPRLALRLLVDRLGVEVVFLVGRHRFSSHHGPSGR